MKKQIRKISTAERYRILHDFQGQRYDLPKNTTILDIFEMRARLSADDIAVVYGDSQLTYAELDGKANTLAITLLSSGVMAGDFVPVLLGNCLELPITFLALMKIAAPFVPLDPDWPKDRIQSLLEQLNAPLVLTQHVFQAVLVKKNRAVLVDQGNLHLTAGMERNGPCPDDPIYGFFTSGSTGIPKCAINIHRGILNRLLYMNRTFKLTCDDVVLQNSRHVFDSSIWQLFWPLINGARVVIPVPSRGFDLRETANLIYTTRVTMTDFVPSIFNMLVKCVRNDKNMREKLQSLRQLLIGGEEMNAQDVYEFKAYFPHVGITNTYGPTETSIGVVFYEVDEKRFNPIPIGKPIDNVNVLILNECLEILPIGEIGEIYIGGVCMGGGYLSDKAKTEGAFIPNPYSEIPSAKLYKTGDLGCYLPDGNIHFVGRKDQQVKVGGVRIELGEIEQVLLQCNGVRQAKVIVEQSSDTRKELVAFVELAKQLDEEDIRRELKRRLPHNMIPKRLLLLDSMPLTHNGKVDRRALEDLLDKPVINSTTTLQPNTENEKDILEVYKRVLRLEVIDPKENFFCLGGDSLTALEVILEVENKTGASISMEEFWCNSSVRELAAFIHNSGCKGRTTATIKDDALISYFEKDLRLENSIVANGLQTNIAPSFQDILLTGATGFLGVHVLGEILKETTAKVYCLVRASSESDGKMVLAKAAQYYGIPIVWDEGRVIIHIGDLSEPLLGLPRVDFEELSDRIDTVVHCGAIVNLVYNYAQIKDTNVFGMHEIVRFASTGRLKWIIHASTVTVLPLKAVHFSRQILDENYLLSVMNLPNGGYHQSKWMEEKLLHIARARGIPCSICRFGEIMPSRSHGVPNPKALSTLLISGCLELGIYPTSSIPIDYMPADDAASNMVRIGISGRGTGSVYNVINPKGVAWNHIMDSFRNLGHPLNPVDFTTFREQLTLRLECGQENRQLLALSLLVNQEIPEGKWIESLFLTEMSFLSRENTISIVQDSPLESIMIDRKLLVEHATRYFVSASTEELCAKLGNF